MSASKSKDERNAFERWWECSAPFYRLTDRHAAAIAFYVGMAEQARAVNAQQGEKRRKLQVARLAAGCCRRCGEPRNRLNVTYCDACLARESARVKAKRITDRGGVKA